MRSTVSIAALAFALAGCATLTPAEKSPRTDPVARLAPAGPSPWTDDFGDAVLTDLLREADAGSLDVKLALAKLEHADAEVEAAQAANPLQLPIGFAGAIGGGTLRQFRSAATPTIEAAYEVDLWGRFKRLRGAARSERRAVAADVAVGRLLVGAETVRAYVALRAAGDAHAAAVRRRADAATALRLTTLRVAKGVATAQEADARARDLAAAQAQLAAVDAEVALQTARLGDLIGRRDLAVPAGAMPRVLADPPSLPSDEVDRRPDVRAALARLAAADQQRASSIAATRPRFLLAAALGSPDASLATLLDVRALAWAAAATVTHNALDGPARRAQVHLASADADAADIAYRQAVLTGWSEIRAALAAEADAARRLDLAQRDLAATRSAMTLGAARHAAGTADGLAVLALQARTEAAADALRAAHVAVVEARVQRRLASGGA